MSVKQINEELKQLAKSSSLPPEELSKKFKYLITATQPGKIITEDVEAVSLKTQVKTSEVKAILSNLLEHSHLISESSYLLLLDYSIMVMGVEEAKLNEYLPTVELTEKHSTMFNLCCRKLFPPQSHYVNIGINLSTDDPFAEETEKHANFRTLISQLKPETLTSISVIAPNLQTELKFLQEWEQALDSDMEFDDQPCQFPHYSTTPMKLMEIASMHLPERTVNMSYLTECFIVWPTMVLLNDLLNRNHSLPLFVKLALIHTHCNN
jgi:hypothetical protein